MHEYIETTVELVVGFFALMLITKMLGRSSISQATPFDFVASLVLGEFVGGAIYDPKVDLFRIIYVVVIWGILIFLVDFIALKFNKSRGLIESVPAILIKNGIINRNVLKKHRLDINRLQSLLRDKDIFSFREVEHAILEPNGKINVIKRPMFDTVKKVDLDLPVQSVSIPVTLISDGVLIPNNLKQINRDSKWLEQELLNRSIKSIRDVMICEWRLEDGLYVQTIFPSQKTQ
ncbi:DUF421 domain-containing protein [Pullulanibacillus sp. KACC 23026]|uniref:DUF421 domain-containing protein n=1 Tax=Pullulanibacillus sp. KACC 23026 TaxID=3028315 RepID=UPI0023AF14E1|nr:DUF421 domain-containing protein [Pullulanibacillus sp. KACC 23026]WEG11902.1 DUF421 domain-containing protein [Pullulanibacillus sp. KACC 23026]